MVERVNDAAFQRMFVGIVVEDGEVTVAEQIMMIRS